MHLVLIVFLAAGALIGARGAAVAQDVPPQLVSLGEEALRDLDNAQLRLLRRAIRGCRAPGVGRFIAPERDPCVMMSTDRAIAQEGDEALNDFHWSLLDSDRYDENRSTNAWRRWLAR